MPLEKQLLPSAELEPVRHKIVWLYVYNDFQKGPEDRAATRIRVRFSVSSWPQLLLVDPWTMDVVGQTGRTVQSFLAAVNRVQIQRPANANARALIKATEEAEELAEKLETAPSKRIAVKALEGDDSMTRFYAAAWLATEHPVEVVKRANDLLAIENDLLRYEICKAIAAAPANATMPAGLRELLEKLVVDPSGSRNPNVLRSHAIKALVNCGTAESVAAIRSLAVDGAPNNGTTFAAIDAIGAIGERVRDARVVAARALIDSLPKATGYDDGGDPERAEWWRKRAEMQAKMAHGYLVTLTGVKVEFPARYDDAEREKLIAAFRAELPEAERTDD